VKSTVKSKIFQFIKRVFTIVIIISIIALLLEGATRLFLLDKIPEAAIPKDLGQFDKILGWTKLPLSSGVSSRTGYEIEYKINSKGLRDSETSYEKTDSVFRIVLLGNSQTFGFGVPIDKHFSRLLEGYFKNVEVINMGIDGYGVDQMLLYLGYEGFKYNPNLVMVFVPHYGDNRHMHSERFGKNKPRFLLKYGKLVLTDVPVVNNSPISANSVFRELDRLFIKYSKAYGIIRISILDLNSQVSKQKQEDKKDLKNDAFVKELNELGAAIVFEMEKEAKAHGASFVLVTKIDSLYNAALKKQFYTLDVNRPLSNHLFLLPDGLMHLNEAGNGAFAWVVANFLQSKQLIPNKYLLNIKPQ
jgi:hypothetical protein